MGRVGVSEWTNKVRPISPIQCCDATGGSDTSDSYYGNIEYDIPYCSQADHAAGKCHLIHTQEAIQPLMADGDADDVESVSLVHVAAHLHTGGISLELLIHETDESLCVASIDNGQILYGNGTKDSVGNELGFLVGSIPCVFDQGRRLKPSTLMRTVAKYNASQEHRGVMSLWLMSAEITKKTTTSEGAIIL